MRTLTHKQKKLLTKWCIKHPDDAGFVWFDLHKCNNFTLELYEELKAINDTEVLYYYINDFVGGFPNCRHTRLVYKGMMVKCKACTEIEIVNKTPQKKLPLLIGDIKTYKGKDQLSKRLKE